MFRAFAIVLSLALVASPALAAEGRDPGPTSPALARTDAIEVVITVVHALPGDKGVAPELDRLQHYLLRAFPKYTSFVRLSSHDQRLAVGAEARLTLPNRHELLFRHTGWKDGFATVHLEVGGLSTTVNVKDGGTFFQAGRAYEGGMIVLAFEVRSIP